MAKNTTPEDKKPTQEELDAKAKAEAKAKAKAEADEKNTKQNENGLLSLHDLAQRHRVPTWQQAALHQFMGWAEGKQVTDADYQAGLEKLTNRRMGGQ